MADTIGLVTLPIATPTVHPFTDRTLAPGDTALVRLASFAAAVLQADCGDAWAALSSGKPTIEGAIDGTADGLTAARRAFFSDPRRGYFEPADLPALFVYRGAQYGSRWLAADIQRMASQIVIAWVMPPAEEDLQRRERDSFVHAVRAAMHEALTMRRHRAWVIDSDRADPDGLKTSFATSTGAVTITSFDGALAAQTLRTGRPITITTTAAAGAYSTAVIRVTGTLDSGLSHTEMVYLTDADGGETIGTLFPFTTPTSVVLPAMLSTGGAIIIGYGDVPDIRKGSLIQRACAFRSLSYARSVSGVIQVEMPDGERRAFEAVEFFLDVAEDSKPDSSIRAYSPWDVETHGTRTHPSDDVFEFVIED